MQLVVILFDIKMPELNYSEETLKCRFVFQPQCGKFNVVNNVTTIDARKITIFLF